MRLVTKGGKYGTAADIKKMLALTRKDLPEDAHRNIEMKFKVTSADGSQVKEVVINPLDLLLHKTLPQPDLLDCIDRLIC